MKIGIFTISGQLSGLIYSLTRSENDLEILWAARTGPEAVELHRRQRVDVFMIAIDIPLVVAKKTVEDLLKVWKCQVLVIAHNLGRDTRFIFELMAAGATDRAIVPKDPTAENLVEFVRKIRNLGNLSSPMTTESSEANLPTLVAIGASTGGPGILTSIMEKLNEPLPAAVIIILHIARSFAVGMVDWMQKYTEIPVQVAQSGDSPRDNNIYLAATDEHLVLTRWNRFRYRDDPTQRFYHPSVDVFFNSIVERQPPGMAVLLTGMGEDGAWGLLELRKAGWHTVAQDEATCVVYGMPKVAADIGAAVHVMNPGRIAQEINVFANIREHRRKYGQPEKRY